MMKNKGLLLIGLSAIVALSARRRKRHTSNYSWEKEASETNPVEGTLIDDPIEPDENAVGTGHPKEHILPNIEDLDDAPPLLGAESKPWKSIDPLTDPNFSPINRGVDLAPVGQDTAWPIVTKHPSRLVTSYKGQAGWYGYSGRAFKSKREDEDGAVRLHAGVDLFGNEGDLVMAPENGDVLTILPFHHGTWAVYIITKDRRVINLGEIEKDSWKEFKVSPNISIKKGDGVGRIGRQKYGSTMIHFEMYDAYNLTNDEIIQKIRNSEFRWISEQDVPKYLYDPTAYLLKAASRTYQKEING